MGVDFDSIFLIVWTLATLFIILVGNLFLIANLAHPNDTCFGKWWVNRIVIWAGFTILYTPLLLVNLDVKSNDDYYRPWWFFIILIQSAFVWIVCPLMIIYYEGNENHTIRQRVLRALKTQMPVFVFLFFITIVTYFFANNAYIPEAIAKRVLGVEPNYTQENNLDEKGEPQRFYKTKAENLSQHIMIVTAFVGHILFAVFAGIGFVSLPWNIFVDYMYRPKLIDEGTFEDRKILILKHAIKLREMGRELDNNRNFVF
jgi:hypothetical protein